MEVWFLKVYAETYWRDEGETNWGCRCETDVEKLAEISNGSQADLGLSMKHKEE